MTIYEDFILHSRLPKRLSPEDEKGLIDLWCNHKDEKAREKLIVHNLRLVKEVINKGYLHTGLDVEDLTSAGIEGLVRAVDNFDPAKGLAFSTLAFVCIQHEIGHLIDGASRQKRQGEVISLEGTKVRSENIEALADRLFEEPSMLDSLVDLDENVEEGVVDKIFTKEIIREVNKVLGKIESRNARIFCAYWGINGFEKQFVSQIAKEEGISKQRAGQIANDVLNKIKLHLIRLQNDEKEI